METKPTIYVAFAKGITVIGLFCLIAYATGCWLNAGKEFIPIVPLMPETIQLMFKGALYVLLVVLAILLLIIVLILLVGGIVSFVLSVGGYENDIFNDMLESISDILEY